MTVGQFLFWYFTAAGVCFLFVVGYIIMDEITYGNEAGDKLQEEHGSSISEDTEKHKLSSDSTKGDKW